MNLSSTWNETSYQEFLNYLNTLQDKKYQEFHSKIIVSKDLIGIKTIELKKIAKEIAKGNYNEFIKYNNSKLYEPIMIEGFIYSYLKIPFLELTEYLNDYLKKYQRI